MANNPAKPKSEPLEYKKARALIDRVLEPKIHEMVTTFNTHLKKYGLAAVGAIEWQFINLNEKETENESSSKT